MVPVGSTSSENPTWILHWVMIYSFGVNTDFENTSQFDTMAVNGDCWKNHRDILE